LPDLPPPSLPLGLRKEMGEFIPSCVPPAVPVEGCTCEPAAPDVLQELRGTIEGPPGSPYEGFSIPYSITVPDEWPFKPVKFLFSPQPLLHPNVDVGTGKPCLDLLADSWSPGMTLAQLLRSVRCVFMADPNPNPGVNTEASRLFTSDRAAFNAAVRAHCEKNYPASGGGGGGGGV
jgi:ubiquitin-conjugating enzyme (huntingtin interacting protein 2)